MPVELFTNNDYFSLCTYTNIYIYIYIYIYRERERGISESNLKGQKICLHQFYVFLHIVYIRVCNIDTKIMFEFTKLICFKSEFVFIIRLPVVMYTLKIFV